jgi:hypothetical protein
MTLQVWEKDACELQGVKHWVRELTVQCSAQETFIKAGVVRQQWTATRKLQELVDNLIYGFCRFEVKRSYPREGRDKFGQTRPFLQATELLKSFNLLASAYLDGTNLDDLIGSLIEACCFQIEENEFLFVFQMVPFYLK